MDKLSEGTVIDVETPHGDFRGRVDRASNYGTPADPDWYIEGHFTGDGKYFYLKQKIDRATITIVG